MRIALASFQSSASPGRWQAYRSTLSAWKEDRRRDRETEGLGGFEIDDQLELCGLFHRQVGGCGHLERPRRQAAAAAVQRDDAAVDVGGLIAGEVEGDVRGLLNEAWSGHWGGAALHVAHRLTGAVVAVEAYGDALFAFAQCAGIDA